MKPVANNNTVKEMEEKMKPIWHIPETPLFKPLQHVEKHMPSVFMVNAQKKKHAENELGRMSPAFSSYILNGNKYTVENILEVMRILLELEDSHRILTYGPYILRNAEVELSLNGKELLVEIPRTQWKVRQINRIDEVLIMPQNYGDLKNRDLLFRKLEECTSKGFVSGFFHEKIRISCHTDVPTNQLYTIVFRPERNYWHYQYKALRIIATQPKALIERLMFPNKQMLKSNTHSATPSIEGVQMRKFYDKFLFINLEQRQAVEEIINVMCKEVPYIVVGPPGTGKTTTIVEAILQLFHKSPETKILITAPSNSSCDEIAVRICLGLKKTNSLYNANVIARIYSHMYESSADYIDEALIEFSNLRKQHFYPDINALCKYRIVVCTLSLIGKLATGDFGKGYTHIFIDDASRATEQEILVSFANVYIAEETSVIISGDPKQLGPIIRSNCAKAFGMDIPMIERLLQQCDCYQTDAQAVTTPKFKALTRLRRNYRSHPAIVKLLNSLYYDDDLIAMAGNNQRKTMNIVKYWPNAPNPDYPIIFHTVKGVEKPSKYKYSFYNKDELQVVMDYVRDLCKLNVKGRPILPKDIGIISPYKGQVALIQELLEKDKLDEIKTGTVEAFQGNEKPIIIASFVRTMNLGFLRESKRINIIVSRAKSLLILIGKSEFLDRQPDLKYIMEECKSNKTFVERLSAGVNVSLEN